LKTSTIGINLIKSFEKCRLLAYDDAQPNVKLTAETKIKGVLTIGWGHTGKVNNKPIKWNTKIIQKTADKLLAIDLHKFEHEVSKYPAYQWTQNEFDALVSFAYNVGSINQLTDFGTRTKETIAKKMVLYCLISTGEKLAGLEKRRKTEQHLFLTKE
jgi:GH24 family phage-related lysozyme (muramidase)